MHVKSIEYNNLIILTKNLKFCCPFYFFWILFYNLIQIYYQKNFMCSCPHTEVVTENRLKMCKTVCVVDETVALIHTETCTLQIQ